MTDTWIQTTDLHRHYIRGPQEVRALDGVTLSVARGEFLGVVGSSGSGKSTLMNLLAGLDTPTAGEVTVGGESLGKMSRRDLARYRAEKVGIVFQSFNLLSHKTAVENVEMALYFDNLPRNQRRTRSVETLGQLGLADRLDHRPADLSGGEQQRVAIARALVKRPEILFADEPTGNLDQDNSTQIAELLQKLNKDGLTVIMITHDLEMATHYSNRLLRLHYGKVIDNNQPETGGAQ